MSTGLPQGLHCPNDCYQRIHLDSTSSSRLRGASSDALAATLFPEEAATARPYALGRELLARQRALIQEGAYRPVPGSTIVPTPDTPLCTRGVAVDRFIDDQLVAMLHALRGRQARRGLPAKLQVASLPLGRTATRGVLQTSWGSWQLRLFARGDPSLRL